MIRFDHFLEFGFYDIKTGRDSLMSDKRIEFNYIINDNDLQYLIDYIDLKKDG